MINKETGNPEKVGTTTTRLLPRMGPQLTSCATCETEIVMIVSDLDGTLLPPPTKVDGNVVHPTMAEGAAYTPITELLANGGSIVGVTGGKIGLQRARFWDVLPLSARREGRVLLFCETGMVLFRPDEKTGEPVEDEVGFA